jgi:valyl-tRNA synthetase
MDTWATSSLTPQIACGWEEDADLFERTFPMNLRPQGPEIIRTWLFATIVRAHYEHDALPWHDTMINGWVLDPDRKKMSKSKGNVVTPLPLVEEYGAEALRYWALSGRPGVDTAVDYGQMKVGRRLAIKILNASKFALGVIGDAPPGATATEALDRSMLAELAGLVDAATEAFEGYDYARALERTERFFWHFCDDYLELVKQRAYGAAGEAGAQSARATLAPALSTILRLFAPHLPYVTEEVWSWWQDGSVHRARWPEGASLRAAATADQRKAGQPTGERPALVYAMASDVIGEVRKAKSEERRSMRTEVSRAVVRDTADRLAALEAARDDVVAAGRITQLVTEPGESFTVDVELASDGA